MGKTTNYSFPTYEATDSPDLTNQYNAAAAKATANGIVYFKGE